MAVRGPDPLDCVSHLNRYILRREFQAAGPHLDLDRSSPRTQDRNDRSTADNMNCAYIAAMVREFLRFFTVVRLSLPRKTIRDIVYDRQFIKKGSTIWLNAWACNIDPEVWQDPLNFRPERWIEQPDAPVFPYGLGYRKCVGSHLANQEMYTLFMRLISCFEI